MGRIQPTQKEAKRVVPVIWPESAVRDGAAEEKENTNSKRIDEAER